MSPNPKLVPAEIGATCEYNDCGAPAIVCDLNATEEPCFFCDDCLRSSQSDSSAA